jgi:plasmid stability protein
MRVRATVLERRGFLKFLGYSAVSNRERHSMKAVIPAVLSLALLWSAPCAVHAQSAEALETAGKLVVRSGLAVQLKSYRKQMEDELSQSRGSLPDDLFEALRDAAQVGFSAEDMQRDITQHIAVNLALADMKQALVWLETDTGRRMTLAEEEASNNMSPQVLQEYWAEYQQRPPDTRRAELIAGLIEATRSVEHAAHSVESIALGIAVGLDAAHPVQNRVGLAELRARLRAVLPPEQLRAQMATLLPVFFAYTYRGVSTSDLSQYLEFNRSPLGNRYNDALMAAFIDTLTRASVNMGPLIEQGMRKKST